MLLRIVKGILLISFLDLAHKKFQIDLNSTFNLIQLGLLVVSVFFLKDLWKLAKAFVVAVKETIASLPLPQYSRVGIVLIAALFALHGLHALFGITVYPITSVEMFKGATEIKPYPDVMVRPKYYYVDYNGHNRVFEPRKEHVWPINEYLGWGFNQEFTFSLYRDFQYKKETYNYLMKQLKPKGIDTLLVGYQVLDYTKDEVTFVTDISAVPENAKIYFKIYNPAHEQ